MGVPAAGAVGERGGGLLFVPLVLLRPVGRGGRRGEPRPAWLAWAVNLGLAALSRYRSREPLLTPWLEWPRGGLTLLWNGLEFNSLPWTLAAGSRGLRMAAQA